MKNYYGNPCSILDSGRFEYFFYFTFSRDIYLQTKVPFSYFYMCRAIEFY